MMESLEMSESSKDPEEPPVLPGGVFPLDEEEEKEGRRRLGDDSGHDCNSPSPYKTALTKIERFLSTPSRRIGNNVVEPVLTSQDKNEPPMDYPVLTSSPFHFKRRDLLLQDTEPVTSSSRAKPLTTPSGASLGGDFASGDDDDQQRLTSGGRSAAFSPPRLPCGLTNFHLSLFFGMIGFILFWLILLLRIYLPVNYFGSGASGSSSSSLHRGRILGAILLNESSSPLLNTTTIHTSTTSSSSTTTRSTRSLPLLSTPESFTHGVSSRDSSTTLSLNNRTLSPSKTDEEDTLKEGSSTTETLHLPSA